MEENSNYLISWFYAESKDDESFYPSVGGNTSSYKFQEVYWICIYDFYSSAVLTQNSQTIKYLFFTNVDSLPTDVKGINFETFFYEIGVQVIQLELTNKTPKDWFGAWRNQFYLFDILDFLSTHYSGNFLILDSDIFFTKKIDDVFCDIEKYKVISYYCGHSVEQKINGISINEMNALYQEFRPNGAKNQFLYKGGEFIGVNSSVIPDILSCYNELWQYNYQRYIDGKRKLNEEAHFLSVIYHDLGYDESIANQYIKRLWTSIKCDNIENGDEKLPIWHMPAEKKYLFKEMFSYMSKDISLEKYLCLLQKKSCLKRSKEYRIMRKILKRVFEKVCTFC